MLYNSVKYKNDEFNKFVYDNTCDINNECIPTDDHYTSQSVINKHTHAIIVEHVQYAISKLKSGKSDCVENLYSDNFKNGTERFTVLLSFLLSSMLVHGVAPAGLLLSTMIPIPKSKRGQKCSSDNYRAIALSSLIGKILDTIILKEQCESLMADSLQFGFKEMSSTITCTSLLIETIEYYTSNNSNCYLLLLDASKAFDRLEYMRLFTILRQHNMCPLVIRLIMNMYINQNMQVRWNSSISKSFHISNGVKQGGVISPVFF